MNPNEAVQLAPLIKDALNNIIRAEGGPVLVEEVRVVPQAVFLDQTYGTAILLPSGGIAVRVAVDRPASQVVDTIIHEAAHVILGPEHVDHADHGKEFQDLRLRLMEKYAEKMQNIL